MIGLYLGWPLKILKYHQLDRYFGPGEISWCLRGFGALPEGTGLIPGTYVAVQTHL